MGNLGFWEITVIGLVILLVFGARRLPEIGASLGKGIREFKRSFSETQDAVMAPEDSSNPSRQLDAPPARETTTTGEPKRLSQ